MRGDVELTSGNAWLLRKTSEACLTHRHPGEALSHAEKALRLKPEDERLLRPRDEAKEDLGGNASQ